MSVLVTGGAGYIGSHMVLGLLDQGDDVVVLDNLPAHKDKKAVGFIEAAKARVLYLPPYSPDLNPDEKLWSKTKSILRRLAERSVARLLEVIEQAVAQVTPKDCVGFFKSCGYA